MLGQLYTVSIYAKKTFYYIYFGDEIYLISHPQLRNSTIHLKSTQNGSRRNEPKPTYN